MRQCFTAQRSIFENYAEHEIGYRLNTLSDILDGQPEIIKMIEDDLKNDTSTKRTGRCGMSVESVFRCLLLKQELQVSYKQLEFLLRDSATYNTFARLDRSLPKKSCLQDNIRRVKPSTLEEINLILINDWIDSGDISCKQLRIDTTVIQANIAPPSDSQLLNDSIRVLSRLFSKSRDQTGIKVRFTDKRQDAKSLAFQIFNAKNAVKERLYPELIKMAHLVNRQSDSAILKVETDAKNSENTQKWLETVRHYKALLCKVIDQTQRRVFDGESVPATEKIVSIFEEHTNIIIKGERDIHFGHKVNMSTISGGFVTHLTIEDGNPNDSSLYLPVLAYHQNHFGCVPNDVVADGCYASQENSFEARRIGVKRTVFSKPVGLSLHQMGVKKKTFKCLKNFRAGIEGNISELKRRFGLSKSTWKKLEGFKAFVWSSVLMYNLTHMARVQME
ncbi:MAG: ISNCY family transposase [Gammaproteobacteria bacterium]